jgi:hypothetical protein
VHENNLTSFTRVKLPGDPLLRSLRNFAAGDNEGMIY